MNKIFAIIILCALILPVQALTESEGSGPLSEQAIETVEQENELNSDKAKLNLPAPIAEDSYENSSDLNYKQPISKKKLAKKFIIAMLCVAGTSMFLYFILSIYNKIREGFVISEESFSDERKSLDTPQDLTEAVKSFINNTKWN